MKKFDLDSQLKAVRVPERDEEYWEDFPRRVTREMRTVRLGRTEEQGWLPRLVLGSATAIVCFTLSLYLGHSSTPDSMSHKLMVSKNEICQTFIRLPDRLRAFLRYDHRLQGLDADQQ